MGVAALTVGGAFRHIGVGEGDTVVISAASGGIGSVAVQYAVARGARVIGIAGAANAEFIRSLGAMPVAYGEGREGTSAQGGRGSRDKVPGLLRWRLRDPSLFAGAEGQGHWNPRSLAQSHD